jgi:ribA/ribD-fused uncharacterized protein
MESEFHFFWQGPFSQWHLCRFTVDNVQYNCAEQFMMAEKARLFGDTDRLKQIMVEIDPARQKKYGRAVANFKADKWNAVCQELVFKGNLAKFSQNDYLKTKLLDTGDKILVEASPYDRIWGIGYNAKDALTVPKSAWGTNWLGQVLMRVRAALRAGTAK